MRRAIFRDGGIMAQNNNQIKLRGCPQLDDPLEIIEDANVELNIKDMVDNLIKINKTVYSVEFMFDDHMPQEYKILVDKNISDFDLLKKIIKRNFNDRSLTEIILTPLHGGDVKKFEANHEYIQTLQKYFRLDQVSNGI